MRKSSLIGLIVGLVLGTLFIVFYIYAWYRFFDRCINRWEQPEPERKSLRERFGFARRDKDVEKKGHDQVMKDEPKPKPPWTYPTSGPMPGLNPARRDTCDDNSMCSGCKDPSLNPPPSTLDHGPPCIKLSECDDVFSADSPRISDFTLTSILDQFPAPPETTPVWWLHRTPSRSKGKVQLCAWTSRSVSPPLGMSTPPKRGSSRGACARLSNSSSDSNKTPSSESSLILDTSFVAFPSPVACSTPVLAKLAYPIACLSANELPDASPTLNIRSRSKSVVWMANRRDQAGDMLQARAQRMQGGTTPSKKGKDEGKVLARKEAQSTVLPVLGLKA